MIRYMMKRCIMIIPIVLGAVFIVFVIIYILPASNISGMPSYGGGDGLDAVFSALNAGTNIWTQYLRYCYNVFTRFDFGLLNSFFIAYRVGLTLVLLALGISSALIIGVPAGIYTALHHDRWQDRTIMSLVLLFSSIPSFCIALILCIIFVKILGILPLIGVSSPLHFIMPTITLAAGGAAMITRITRASVLDVLSQSYIAALRAKGLKERAVVYIHVLRNALIPVVSQLSTLAVQILFNSFVVEYFFNIRGIGSLLLYSVGARNHMVILCSSVVFATILSIVFIVSDLLCTLVDPRIRLRYVKTTRVKKKESAG